MLKPTVDINNPVFKSYASPANAMKAIEKAGLGHLRFMLPRRDDGRVVPFFLGNSQAYLDTVHRGFQMIGFGG